MGIVLVIGGSGFREELPRAMEYKLVVILLEWVEVVAAWPEPRIEICNGSNT